MRSDKNKKTDPNREIDDFLSKFDDASDTESEAFNNYLDEDNESSSSKQNFKWKEVEPVKSANKKHKNDKAERKITKDPAPSSIKVERNKDDSDNVHTYPVENIIEPDSNKPDAVEPEKADAPREERNTVSSKPKKVGRKKKKAIAKAQARLKKKEEEEAKIAASAEDILHQSFGDSVDPAEELDAMFSDSEKAEDSEPKADDELIAASATDTAEAEPDHSHKFKGLFSFLAKKEDKPVEVEDSKEDVNEEAKEELDKTKELESLFGIESSDDNAESKPESESEAEAASDSESVSETEITAEEEVVVAESESESKPESDSEEVIATGAEAETETDAEVEAIVEAEAETEPEAEEEKASEAETAAIAAFSLLNNQKSEKSPINTDYIKDPETGEYRKVSLGKRKRIEFKDLPTVSTAKKSGLALFGAKKEKKLRKDNYPRRNLGQFLFCRKNKKYRPEEGATYELDGKTIKNKPYKFSFLKLFRDFVVIGLLMLMAAVGVGYKVIKEATVYDYNDVYATVATASVVYDDQGKQIDNIYYTENRRIVKYEDMPESLIEAFVAIEDKTFWKHHGFNWIRMIGAVYSSITGHGQISGTSTITQQLSRNIYLPEEKSERTIKRKFLEMYYAARLEHALSKEQIIEAYLNTIYLGYGCYGVNSAASTYFSKDVKDLSVLECAALAALPQAPHNYALLKNASDEGDVSEDSIVVAKSPQKVVTNDISKDRRNLTLDLMLEQELISQDEYNASYNKALNDFINPNIQSPTSIITYFHDYLIDTIISDLMEQKDLSREAAERVVYTGGLQIYSTIDMQAQQIIADEFRDDSNFPGISAIWRQDGAGNILNNDGKIALYDYEDYFDEEDNFTLSGDNEDIVFHSDGSATINSGHNLNIYETEVEGQTDYSIEFKNYYVINDGILYSMQGGFVNIPAAYKSGDGNGNVKISADFFNDDQYKNAFKKDGNNLIIADTGYSLGQQVRQPQAAMVIVQVGTGEVKAMVGGRQFKGQKLLNRAVNSRQPGSSIKPLAVYGAALQKSYELASEGKKWQYVDFKMDKQGTKGWGDYVTVHSSIEDERLKINGKYWPKNAGGGYSGTNNFRTAIQASINTCAVKLLRQVTPEYALAQVKKFGITTTIDEEQNEKTNDVNPAAMALGAMTEGVEPLEMALAYASFPAGGKVNTPICYTKILDRDGNVLLEGKSEQTEALNEGVAWIMTDVLKSVVSKGIAWAASIDDVNVGGKTGTTNDQYDIWFDGFTPSYAAALWIGTDQNIEMSEMSGPAARLWGNIMNQIPRAKEGSYPERPSNVVEKWGDYYTSGTEVGLSSWSYAAEKKKARDAAYKKWLSERENHKKKVLVEKEKTVNQVSEEITVDNLKSALEKKAAGYDVKEIVDSSGNRTGKYICRKYTPVKIPAVYKDEYEPGWRDGDFSYTFDGETFTD